MSNIRVGTFPIISLAVEISRTDPDSVEHYSPTGTTFKLANFEALVLRPDVGIQITNDLVRLLKPDCFFCEHYNREGYDYVEFDYTMTPGSCFPHKEAKDNFMCHGHVTYTLCPACAEPFITKYREAKL